MENESAHGDTRVGEVVRLSVPGSLEFVRVVRLTAAAVAARERVDVEKIEDQRGAGDEFASVVIEAGSGAEITFAFSNLDSGLLIEGSASVDRPPVLDDLTRQILNVVVEGVEIDATGGVAHFRATKRSSKTE